MFFSRDIVFSVIVLMALYHRGLAYQSLSSIVLQQVDTSTLCIIGVLCMHLAQSTWINLTEFS